MATRKKPKQYGDGAPDFEELVSGVQGLFGGRGNTAKATTRGVSAPKINPRGSSRTDPLGLKPGIAPSKNEIAFGNLRTQGYQGNGGLAELLAPKRKSIAGALGERPATKDATTIRQAPSTTFNGNNKGIASGIGALMKNGLSVLKRMQESGQDITEPLAVFGKTLDDYIAEAGDGRNLVAGQLSALDQQKRSLTGRAAEGDAKINEIYAQLANSMGQEGENATARYADASKQVQANTDAASGAIQAARSAATAGQSEIAQNLGITDRAPSEAQVNQGNDRAASLSGIQVNGLSGRNLLDTLGGAQADYFQGNKAASQFRGAEARTALQRDLQGQLGDLSMTEAQTLDGARQQALQLAQQRYAADLGQFEGNRNYADSMDDRAYSRGQDRYRLEQDYALQKQQMENDRAASEAEYAAETGKANQPATFLQIQQQLAQSMPAASAAKAVQAMSSFKTAGGKGDLKSVLVNAGITDPAELALAMGYAQEFLNQYKY